MRYVIKPKSWCETPLSSYEYENIKTVGETVICEERDTFSGLFDAEGNELHRVRNPIGFIHKF